MSKRVKRLFRPLVRRSLSPRTVQDIRFCSWYLSSYLPRLISASLIGRTAQVLRFGMTEAPSSLAMQIQTVNLLAPTETCRVMAKWGSDKTKNSYTPVYSALFRDSHNQTFENR